MLSGSYGIGRLCPAQARSAPMSGVHKGRDQSGESPQWRAPGCPKGGIPPPLTPTRSRLTNIKTPKERLTRAPSHRYRYDCGVATASADGFPRVTPQRFIVTVWTDLMQLLHTAGISSASNSPSCPASEREGSVSVFNCGATSALRMVDTLEAARLTVNPLETSPASSKIPRDGA